MQSLRPSTELDFLAGTTQPDSKFTEVNEEAQHHRQDGADPKPGQETRRKHQSYPVCCLEYLFGVLEFTDWSCVAESWQPEPSAKSCYFGCIRTPEINPKKLLGDFCLRASASLNSAHPNARDEPGLAELLQPWLERQYCAGNTMCLVLLTLHIHLIPLQPSGSISEWLQLGKRGKFNRSA